MARLLILDDDAAVGDTIGNIAAGIGMESRSVTCPLDFFSVLEWWCPTHIVLDLKLPDIDGIEVIHNLARNGCGAMVILLSGLDERVMEAARRSGVEQGLSMIGVVPKPFKVETLREMFLNGEPMRSDVGRQEDTPAVDRDELARAIDQREFTLAYQPKVACADRTLVGFEALARWPHPRHGMIMPATFIPLAELHDLIHPITSLVLDEAMSWLAGSVTGPAVGLSVNLSARTLSDSEFIGRLDDACAVNGIDPGRVTLELTETAALDDPQSATDLLARLRVKGYQVSLDDFGSGYSTLVQLSRMPFSEIKVDKTFVMDMLVREESHSIVEAVVRLGHDLHIKVTAEGVEDERTLQRLAALGCDFAQGYHIARPLDPEAARDWCG